MKRLILPARPEELVGINMARGPEVTRRLRRVIARIDTSPLTRRAIALFILISCISVTTLAGLRVVHAGEANLPPTKTINPADVPLGARVLHFPSDRSLGLIYVSGKHHDEHPYYYMWTSSNNWGDYDWEHVGEARGDVLIPAGKLVKLEIPPPAIYGDLSPLAKLAPDAVYQLELRYDYSHPDGPADKTPAGFNPSTLLAPFAGWTGLKVLDINYTRIGDKGLEPLRGFTSLERLYPGRGLGEKGLQIICGLKSLKGLYILLPPPRASLAQLTNLDKLEDLWIYKKNYAAADLEMFPSMRSLKWLHLAGSVQDRALAPIARMPAIKHLQLSDGTTDRHLAILAASRTLEDINAGSSNQITDAGVASLKSMPALKSLNVRSSRLSNKSIETLSQIKTLEEISCTAVDMNDDTLVALARLPNLRKIDFPVWFPRDSKQNKRNFTARGLAALADKNTLEDLWIGGEGIDDAALAQIARMTNLTQLHIFSLVTATNAGFARLGALKSLERLTLFNYSDAITIAGLKQLGSLPRLKDVQLRDFVQDYSTLDLSGMPNLEMLQFSVRSGQKLRDEDMACFAGMKRMRWLDLTRAGGVTDEGIRHIAGMTGLEAVLRLDTSRLTDAGMKTLSGMQELKSLDIGGHIGDAGLAEIAKLNSLMSLRLSTTAQISPAGMDALQALPFLTACNIGSPQTSNPAAVGKDVEDITYTSLAGKQMKLSEMKKIVMVHFWSTWDKPCLDRAELERLRRVNEMMTQKYPGKFALISLALDSNDALWRETVKREGMTWLQGRLNSSSHYTYSYGIKSLPAYFLLTPGGKVLLNPESSWKDLDAAMAKGLGKTLRVDGYMQ